MAVPADLGIEHLTRPQDSVHEAVPVFGEQEIEVLVVASGVAVIIENSTTTTCDRLLCVVGTPTYRALKSLACLCTAPPAAPPAFSSSLSLSNTLRLPAPLVVLLPPNEVVLAPIAANWPGLATRGVVAAVAGTGVMAATGLTTCGAVVLPGPL